MNDKSGVWKFPHDKEKFFRKAMSMAFRIWADEINRNKSYGPTMTSLSIHQLFEHCLADRKADFSIVLRNRHQDYVDDAYFQIYVNAIGLHPEYRLCAEVAYDKGCKLIEEFNLLKLA